MLIEQALMTFLLAQSGITALVGANSSGGKEIHFVIAPQNVVAPYIVVTKIDSPRDHSRDGGTGLASPRFQLSIFAERYSTAKGIAVAVQAALQGYNGTMGGDGGVYVANAVYEDETDLEPGEMGLFGVAADYIIEHEE